MEVYDTILQILIMRVWSPTYFCPLAEPTWSFGLQAADQPKLTIGEWFVPLPTSDHYDVVHEPNISLVCVYVCM